MSSINALSSNDSGRFIAIMPMETDFLNASKHLINRYEDKAWEFHTVISQFPKSHYLHCELCKNNSVVCRIAWLRVSRVASCVNGE